jgi:hypothetical protein
MATRTSETRKTTRTALAAKPIKLSPRRALAKVRKPVAPPTRDEDLPSRYRRADQRRRTREIIVDEVQGC